MMAYGSGRIACVLSLGDGIFISSDSVAFGIMRNNRGRGGGMKILISPAKTMRADAAQKGAGRPILLGETEKILCALRGLSYEEAKRLWKCSDKLAELNYRRIHEMDLTHGAAALFLYDGLQFKSIGIDTLPESEKAYLAMHLRILSAFYGVLAPFDGIVPYRLEMQAKLSVEESADPYEFWGRRLYDSVMDEDRTMINLASKEYALAILPFLTDRDRMVTAEFLTEREGKCRQESTYAKMGRGEMVRFLAETGAKIPETMKEFSALGFHFDEDRSDENRYVFIRHGE